MRRKQAIARRRARPAGYLFLSSLAAGAVFKAPAQVVYDGKFGTSGAVAGPNYSIAPEAGAIRGNNLFHSFSQFNVATGESATFTGPANIQNILARVTGGSPSSIDGALRSEIGGANLFLINPKGISFGPNASVDVSGSFAASTADYLKLADGARFAASLDADDSALSTAPVAEFGFLGPTRAPITVEKSALSVPEGKDFTFVAGDILLDGATIKAPAGSLHLTSGEGTIALQNSAQADVSGEGGGRVVIRGGKLTVDSSKIEANSLGSGAGQGIDIQLTGDLSLSNGGQINSLSPGGLGAGGDIQITSQSIRLDGGGLMDDFFNPTTQISAATGDQFTGGGLAPGGNITLHTGRLELVNSAQVSSASFGSGDGGRIEIEADSIFLDAQLFTIAQITANTQSFFEGGRAGDVKIRAGTLDLLNGGTVLAASFGSAPAGEIDINAREVNLLSGGVVAAPTFMGGAGGTIRVTADHLRIDGRNLFDGGDNFISGLQAVTTSADQPGAGGNIEVKAGFVELLNDGSIFTSSLGLGQGGNIDIAAGQVSLDRHASIRAAGDGAGPAGNISVRSTGLVQLNNQSSIATSAPGSSGGNIEVRSGAEMRLTRSEITAQAGLDGGNIALSSPSLLLLQDSTVTGQADTTGSGFGNGGNLTLEPTFLILKNGSLVSKSSFGNGGNISILSDVFFPSASIIDASAPFGLPGTVQVTAPEVDLSGVLAVLVGNFIDATALLRPDCGVRLGGTVSSFIVAGRGGLPILASGFVPSAALGEWHDQK